MKPSRTFTMVMTAISAITLLGLAILVLLGLVSWLAPDQLGPVSSVLQTFATFALALAGLGGGGAGAMAHRDASSGGLTSSQGHTVVASRSLEGAVGDE